MPRLPDNQQGFVTGDRYEQFSSCNLDLPGRVGGSASKSVCVCVENENAKKEASMCIKNLSQVGFGGAALLGVLVGLACVVLVTLVT
jgi:hypothetical protein